MAHRGFSDRRSNRIKRHHHPCSSGTHGRNLIFPLPSPFLRCRPKPWPVVAAAGYGLPCDPPVGSCNEDQITPGRAALRDFKPVYVGSGSKREATRLGLMSASAGCGHARPLGQWRGRVRCLIHVQNKQEPRQFNVAGHATHCRGSPWRTRTVQRGSLWLAMRVAQG